MSKIIFEIVVVTYVAVAYLIGLKVGMWYMKTKAKWGR